MVSYTHADNDFSWQQLQQSKIGPTTKSGGHTAISHVRITRSLSLGKAQYLINLSKFRWTAKLIISNSVQNCDSPMALVTSFSRFTATIAPSPNFPLYTFPKPPTPRMLLELKFSVADWSSLKVNFLRLPKLVSPSSWLSAKNIKDRFEVKNHNQSLLFTRGVSQLNSEYYWPLMCRIAWFLCLSLH